MSTQDPAVTAAALAIARIVEGEPVAGTDADVVAAYSPEADAAVAAARPIIEAEVRERIAAEIEAEAASLRATEQPDYIRAALDLEVAARIARGTA